MFTRNPQTTSLEKVGTPVAASLAKDIQNNAGKIDISEGMVIELWPVAKTTKVNVTNPNTAKSADVTVYVFNENTLKNTFSDNVYPDGAADIDKPTVAYNDGFKGNFIKELIHGSNQGRGLKCVELTIIGKDASGVQSDEAILALDAALQSYNPVRGTAMPLNVDFGEAIRNSAFKDGFVTVAIEFWVNRVSQFTFPCPKGYSYELKFKWAS